MQASGVLIDRLRFRAPGENLSRTSALQENCNFLQRCVWNSFGNK
jgi:hypothetical protein